MAALSLAFLGIGAYRYFAMPSTDRAYFDWWTGQNQEIVTRTLQDLPEPYQFEHVQTIYQDHGKTYRITMDYYIHDIPKPPITQAFAELDKSTRQLIEYQSSDLVDVNHP